MKNNLLVAHAIAALACVASSAAIPLDLPRPDGKPGNPEKPVKVYLLSGQSNMVGMGDLRGASPEFPSVFLSADPAIIPGVMPIGGSALRTHGIHQSAAPDAAPGAIAKLYTGTHSELPVTSQPVSTLPIQLGTVSETLPTLDGPHTVVVNAWIDVPETGHYKMHAGFGASSHAIIVHEGRQVHQGTPGQPAKYETVRLESGKRHEITITFLQPGSAAFWLEQVGLEGKGDLETLVKKDGKFPYLIDDEGNWTERQDVYFREARLSKGGRGSLLSATSNGNSIGPELGFGSVLGNFHDEQVLLIKTAQGNRALGFDFRPPSSGRNAPDSEWEGLEYRLTVQGVRETLEKIDEIVPGYNGQGYEIAGFAWWQGHKDAGATKEEYEKNLINLIEDLRKEFNAPDMRAVVATVGFDGYNLGENYQGVWQAQMAVGDPTQHPEFSKLVASVDTRDFWRETHESPRPQGHHYHRNAETYLLVGEAMGREMVRLLGGNAEPIPKSDREARTAAANAALAAMPEISHEQRAASNAAARPMILEGALISFKTDPRNLPALQQEAAGIKPAKLPQFLDDTLDAVTRYYQTAGISDYDWQPFGPDLNSSEWHYLTFNQPETTDSKPAWAKTPPGMESWFTPAFDPSQAKWKSGHAPFGPETFNEDLPPHLSWASSSRLAPKTVITDDVLLLRQTVDLPPLKADHRYRIVVDGSARSNAGDGYSLHVNGTLIAETNQPVIAWRRAGGRPRGGHIYTEFRDALPGGKVTLAASAFPAHNPGNAVTPHRNTLRVWIEEQKLPPDLPPTQP